MQYFQNLPIFEIPQKFKNSTEYFKYLVIDGLSKRYPKEQKAKGEAWEVIMRRANYEMDIIIKHNFVNYFLIVYDYINWAKTRGFYFGPGRGSSAGSIVTYALKITKIDPLQYNLLFERFINSEMLNPPDINVDIDYEERDKVIEYIVEKYGQERVGQSLTFNEKYKTFYVDSAGIVISKLPLQENLPVIKDTKTGVITVYCNRNEIDEYGLAKLFIFPSKIHAIIKHTVEEIKMLGGNYADFCIDDIPNNDLLTYKILIDGNTDDIYQFSSDKMKEICIRTKPEKITDLVALYALCHLELMMHVDTFIENKNNVNNLVYPDPCMEDILIETYGVIIYQEQIILIIQRITGYSLGKADALRRDMKDGDKEKLCLEKEAFINCAISNGFTKEKAVNLFELMVNSAPSCFNKSHAVAYAKLAYQSAYLKANFPDQYKNTCCKYRGIYGIIQT